MSPLPTVKVAYPGSPSGYMIINRADYDPKRHAPYTGAPAQESTGNVAGDGGAGGSDEGGEAATDLRTKTIAELKAFASEKNIDLGEHTRKADIVATIEAALA